jgi:MFS family permease
MPDETLERGKYTRLSALLVGYFAIGLDSYLVITALPAITKGLHISFGDAGWVLLVALVSRQVSVLVSGRAGDRYGRKTVFIWGAALFGLGAILSTSAPGYYMLLVFRVFQGLAAGMMEANFPALVTVSFPSEERGRALGFAATAIALSALVGVIASGLISYSIGWRYIFVAVVPFCAAAIPMVHYLVPESKGLRAGPRDARGSVLLLSTLVSMALFLSYGSAAEWSSPLTLMFIGLTVTLGVALYFNEKNARSPLISTKLLKIRAFSVSIMAYLAVITCQMLIYLTIPFFLDYYMGLTTRGAGLILVIPLGTTLFFLVPSGIAADSFGTRALENAGVCFILASFLVLAFWGETITMFTTICALALLGIGGGLFASPNYSAIMGSAPRPSLGVAGGLYGAAETMGTFFAFALADGILGRWGDVQGSAQGARLALFNSHLQAAVRNVYFAGFLVALAGLVICLMKYRSLPSFKAIPRQQVAQV